jgi:BirA family transcriptional regulator, biotin operon repressor / biotin---[acetyl-CoA-carboxylase] ligase
MLRIVRLLCDGEYHSGEELGKTLNITRSAIWKLVKQLSQWDLEVESRTGLGYRIPNGLKLLDIPSIQNHIEAKQLALLDKIEIFTTLPSTNDYLMNKKSEPKETCAQVQFQNQACFAEMQTQGKGRLGRPWYSPFAKNIYLSLLWHFPKDISELSGLSLATATAILKTLQKFGIAEAGLKWPNDILWKNQKLAGTLIEVSGEAHDTTRTVIGIGLNVAVCCPTTQKINQPWTDLQTILDANTNSKLQKEQEESLKAKSILDRNRLSGLLLNELIQTLTLFQEEGLRPFLPYWQEHDLSKNKAVSLITPHHVQKGLCLGINDRGYCLLKTENGEILSFSTGEISLRLASSEK